MIIYISGEHVFGRPRNQHVFQWAYHSPLTLVDLVDEEAKFRELECSSACFQ